MVITSLIFFEVTRCTWRWPLWRSLPLLLLFLSFDMPFFAANLFKFVDGGYVPVLLAAVLSVVMITWNRGRRIYGERVDDHRPADRRLPGGAPVEAGRAHPGVRASFSRAGSRGSRCRSSTTSVAFACCPSTSCS